MPAAAVAAAVSAQQALYARSVGLQCLPAQPWTSAHVCLLDHATHVLRTTLLGLPLCCCSSPQCLGDLKSKDLSELVQQPGEHDALNPEYSILRSRLARRLLHEGIDTSKLDLVSVTAAAERTITSDLEFLISKAVDPTKADYAVITGEALVMATAVCALLLPYCTRVAAGARTADALASSLWACLSTPQRAASHAL